MTAEQATGASWRRIAVVLVTAAPLTALAVVVSIAGITRYNNPSLALRIAPFDSVANANQADRLLQPGATPADIRAAAAHARAALRRSALSPTAMRILGFIADGYHQREKARTLLLHAAQFSHRDLATRLWLINDAVVRNDAVGALDQFDIAMRSSTTARDVLFPILTNAIADPAYMDPVTRVFRRSPNWLTDFVVASLASGRATENLSIVLARLDRIPDLPGVDLAQRTVDQLVAEQRYAAARRFYTAAMARGRRGATPGALLNDGVFKVATGLTPFDWQLVTEPTYGVQRTDSGGINLYADADASGVVATQLLTLAPGSYRLMVRGSASTSDRYGGAEWVLACAPPGSVRLTLLPLPSRTAPGGAAISFTVPSSSCDAQWLRLSIKPSQSPEGISGRVRAIGIVPART